MKRCMLILLALLALFAPSGPGGTPQGAAADTKAGLPVLYRETGHTLAYSFRQFWERNGGLAIFGYPLTEVFVEDGRPVQYFERARLEWHANLGLVLAGHLGRWAAGRASDPAFAARSGAAYPEQMYFPESDHTLGGLFRQYWERNGGLPVYGLPLSEEFLETNQQDGATYTVQYFERARFEYHPELPPRYQVSLGHLGRQYLAAVNPAPQWALEPAQSADAAWSAVRPTRIKLNRIGLDTEIVEAGFSLGAWDVPRYTAAHYWPVSAFPGSAGNVVIAGHVGYRDTIFNRLPQAVVGDEIIVLVAGKERRYRITDIATLLPSDTWTMNPTSDETLTLITCVPIGTYTHRLTVRAKPIP